MAVNQRNRQKERSVRRATRLVLAALALLIGGLSGWAWADDAAQKAMEAMETAMGEKAGIDGLQFDQTMKDYLLGRFDKAFPLLKEFAEKGNPVAQNSLGNMYGSGIGVAKDAAAEALWQSKAADQGYPPAMVNVAARLLRSDAEEKKRQGLALLEKAVAAGSIAGNSLLGEATLEGNGTPKNISKAVSLLEKAAEGGERVAMAKLGWLFVEERAKPGNLERGMSLLRQSLEQGEPRAYYSLGKCSEEGVGVPQNAVRAMAYYTVAKKLGYGPAQKSMETLSEKMTWQQLLEARRLAW